MGSKLSVDKNKNKRNLPDLASGPKGKLNGLVFEKTT